MDQKTVNRLVVIRKRAEKLAGEIGKRRDKLRDLLGELEEIADSADEGTSELADAIAAMSRAEETLSRFM